MTSSTPDPEPRTIRSYDLGAAIYAERSRDRGTMARLHGRFQTLMPAHGRVLDLGCGPGHDAAILTHAGFEVLGLDPARGLLREATRHAELNGVALQGDARQLPFTRAAFDGVWACASLLHLPPADVALALAEAFRVLRPSGLLFTSMQHGEAPPLRFAPGDGLPERVYFFYSFQNWLSLIEAAGFDSVSQQLGPSTNGLNEGANAWIETFARKP